MLASGCRGRAGREKERQTGEGEKLSSQEENGRKENHGPRPCSSVTSRTGFGPSAVTEGGDRRNSSVLKPWGGSKTDKFFLQRAKNKNDTRAYCEQKKNKKMEKKKKKTKKKKKKKKKKQKKKTGRSRLRPQPFGEPGSDEIEIELRNK